MFSVRDPLSLRGRIVQSVPSAVIIDNDLYDYLPAWQPWAYWNSDKGITLAGSSVTGWADQSGNERHWEQNSEISRRPTYQTNQVNGRAWLNFNEDYMWGPLAGKPWDDYAGMTIIGCWDKDNTNDTFISKYEDSLNDYVAFRVQSNGIKISKDGAAFVAESFTPFGDPEIYAFRWKPNSCTLRVNKSLIVTLAGAYDALFDNSGLVKLKLGGVNSDGSNALDGKMLDTVIYNWYMSDETLGIIEDRMKAEFAV